ncbi:hypothetical protein [Escherichia coli]|uniref:hypothetical protein n=1 Tax=Escherichia coli TaxID=562 RepID=UPI0010CC675A|nr:hypothetical protein [Escherichia coli]GDE74579.1 hypothetical protein HmCmsJML281_02256 [Escherichia coli]
MTRSYLYHQVADKGQHTEAWFITRALNGKIKLFVRGDVGEFNAARNNFMVKMLTTGSKKTGQFRPEQLMSQCKEVAIHVPYIYGAHLTP